MFAKAYAEAAKWIRPVVTSMRYADGRVDSDVATMIVVNRDGWALTAGHVFDSFIKAQQDAKKIQELKSMNGGKLSVADPNMILAHSNWFGDDGIKMTQVTINRACDFALMKLEGVKDIGSYPVFRDPGTVVPGTGLCRIGYWASDKVRPEYHSDRDAFEIPKGAVPALFPNDGIHTRNVVAKVSNVPPGEPEPLFVEMSSPGLKGQSGGPIVDAQGRVYAMQSRTMSFDTGFRPEYAENGISRPVPQFINLGWGVHVKILRGIMDKMNVAYRTDDGGSAPAAEAAAPPATSGADPQSYEVGPDGSKYIID